MRAALPAGRGAVRAGAGAATAAVVFLLWTQMQTGTAASAAAFAAAAVALLAGLSATLRGREGWAFLSTFVAIAVAVAGLFLALFPDVMPTSLADVTATGMILAAIAVFGTLLAAVVGGKAGERYHRRVDRAAL